MTCIYRENLCTPIAFVGQICTHCSDHAGFGFDVEVGSGWSEVMHQVRGCCLPTGVGHGRHRKQAACFEVEFVVGVSVVVFDAKSNTTKRIAGTMGTAVRSPIAGTMGTAVQCAMRCPVLVQAAFLVLRVCLAAMS